MTRSLSANFARVRAVLDEHGRGDDREAALKQLDDLTHRVPLLNQLATRSFSEILDLLRTGRVLEPTESIRERVLQRALDKRAPFHRAKNNVADALLIELYGDAVSFDGSPDDQFCFVTINTKDFSLPEGDSRRPHPELAGFFSDSRSHYYIALATALTTHFPDEVDDLFADLDYHEEPRSLAEIRPLLDRLGDQIWYNRHKNREYRIEIGEIEVVDDWRPADHQRTIVREVWRGAQGAARRIEEKYGTEELGPWSDFEWGMLSGKLPR